MVDIKKLLNIIKDVIRIYNEDKNIKHKLKIGMCFRNISNNKCYITNILKNESETQVVYKYYFKTTISWIYCIEDLEEITGWFKGGGYRKTKK